MIPRKSTCNNCKNCCSFFLKLLSYLYRTIPNPLGIFCPLRWWHSVSLCPTPFTHFRLFVHLNEEEEGCLLFCFLNLNVVMGSLGCCLLNDSSFLEIEISLQKYCLGVCLGVESSSLRTFCWFSFYYVWFHFHYSNESQVSKRCFNHFLEGIPSITLSKSIQYIAQINCSDKANRCAKLNWMRLNTWCAIQSRDIDNRITGRMIHKFDFSGKISLMQHELP